MINQGLPNELLWAKDFMRSSRFDEIIQAVRDISTNSIETYLDMDQGPTPRHQRMRRGDLDLQPFYILDYISRMSRGPIYDIGCGFNFFKNFYNIIGIDPHSLQADIQASYSLEMATENKGKMDNVFSINAIHFCSSDELKHRVKGFFDMVKPDGYAYLAINVARIFDDVLKFEDLSKDQRSKANEILSNYAKANVLDICEDEVIYWKDTIANKFDSYVNGNIKILARKRA